MLFNTDKTKLPPKQKHSRTTSVRLFICLLGMSHLLPPTTQASDQIEISAPAKGHGFLLMNLDIKASAAIMTLKQIGRSSKAFDIKLTPTHGRWLLHPLPQGEYQITQINVPYFDLPHAMDTAKNPRWRIRIQANQINYAGRMEIERERTERQVSVRKLNRVATDLPLIQRELSSSLALYPLVAGNTLRDDFAEEHLLTTEPALTGASDD